MPASRITQKEIARQLGLTQAAVSLALARHASIPEKTQAKVGRLARKLGYVPDPFLSGLSAYRKRVRPSHFQATLAWLSNYPTRDGWRKSYVFHGYFEGAVRRAAELGYKLEEHWLHEDAMTPARMEHILAARNVNGLLLAPQPKPNLGIEFSFDRFPALAFGYTLVKPLLHRVTLHQFEAMKTTFRKLLALGYRRPGMAFDDESDVRVDRHWSAAFCSEQRSLPPRDRVPPLLAAPFDQAAFTKWFRKHRPDAVVAIWPVVHEWLREAGAAVPQSTGFAMVSVPDEGRKFSGIWENPQITGAKAVEFLVDMIHRNECGVPEVPLYVLIGGSWKNGTTVRPQRAG